MKISTEFTTVSALLLCLSALLWLTGCASSGTPAPVDNREQARKSIQRSAPKGTVHRVQKGETLYSIAWRYGLDYHQLAGWNGVDSSYKIYPGQLLRLKPSSTSVAVAKPTAKNKSPASTQSKPKPKPATTAAPSKKTPPAQTAAKPVKQKTTPPRRASSSVSGGSLKWVWPTRGTVVQRFRQGDRTRQGVRIAGKVGQAITAAESGKVVYTGSGLPGYGKLIIVKHNKNYLSAYGFNRKLLVKDGDHVARGERLAEMGQSTDGKSLLHFEIRRRDKPLDPLKLLPRR